MMEDNNVLNSVFISMDTDPMIFEKERCVNTILHICPDISSLKSATARVDKEMTELKTARKTLLAENHGCFLTVADGPLRAMHTELVTAVSHLDQLDQLIRSSLEAESPLFEAIPGLQSDTSSTENRK